MGLKFIILPGMQTRKTKKVGGNLHCIMAFQRTGSITKKPPPTVTPRSKVTTPRPSKVNTPRSEGRPASSRPKEASRSDPKGMDIEKPAETTVTSVRSETVQSVTSETDTSLRSETSASTEVKVVVKEPESKVESKPLGLLDAVALNTEHFSGSPTKTNVKAFLGVEDNKMETSNTMDHTSGHSSGGLKGTYDIPRISDADQQMIDSLGDKDRDEEKKDSSSDDSSIHDSVEKNVVTRAMLEKSINSSEIVLKVETTSEPSIKEKLDSTSSCLGGEKSSASGSEKSWGRFALGARQFDYSADLKNSAIAKALIASGDLQLSASKEKVELLLNKEGKTGSDVSSHVLASEFVDKVNQTEA